MNSLFASKKIVIEEPLLSRKLFSEAGPWSVAWLVIRIYVGWAWLHAGWGKLNPTPDHMWGPDSILGYWKKAVVVPATGKAAITYDWYRSFLEFLISIDAHTWFASVIAWGEFLVGVGLILGAFVGVAAFFGATMNMNFLLAGSTSSNPVLLVLAILLVLAWKTAGWWGLDRWLLPRLGTPWTRVTIVEKT